ncbi:hypothetical protein I6F07_33495, partial [Ensifer sp. IC4062]|nr:hypothetical protein [Ensifer sp. IC4062]
AVREAASLSSTAAVREKVIDFTAVSIEDLLKKAHGRTVRVGQDSSRRQKLEDQPIDADDHQKQSDIRIGDHRQEAGSPVGQN